MNISMFKNLSCLINLFKTPAQHKKFLSVLLVLLLFYTCTGKYVANNEFDYLIFSQRWLPSACIEYIEHHASSAHHCIKPKNFASWAIHGLWPTQYNHMGPFFCNKSSTFNITQLTPIESELKLNWPNIEEGKSVASLWEHEWEKHGTCAAQLESLNSEIEYFGTTLKFFKIINIQTILTNHGILPRDGKGVNATDLFNIIKNVLGKMPQVHCIHEVRTKRPYLSEIRLCYNKKLELIDCGNVKSSKSKSKLDLKNTLIDCPLNSEVIYPQSVISKSDKLVGSPSEVDYYDTLAYTLRVIRFLQWVSI